MDHGAQHHAGTNGSSSSAEMPGLSIERSGYQIRDLAAPAVVGEDGTLSFRLTGPGGVALTEYDTAHDKDLHLIVVRSDGAEFRHVHPNNDGDGRWSMPWRWNVAGSYRVFADAVPTGLGSNVTLTSTTSVAGHLAPRALPPESAVATVGDFTVTLDGSLGVGATSTLKFTVTRAGRPVQTLEPYLGAYGHLVALRTGDLGYLHVHPMGEPGDGITQPGPDIEFMAAAPTDGTYLLYLDFKVDGQVRTAEFTVTAAAAAAAGNTTAGSPEHEHSGTGH
ncbi:hypothetical protein [Mycolicibacterium nivoides]|uniref:Heavy metal-binding domain-containing protein n=1 Tax=Mycolicibacterium nivoides TaxID=2487344 RepID=A0ABW9L908_9MYCO